jgi:hypothetical protein
MSKNEGECIMPNLVTNQTSDTTSTVLDWHGGIGTFFAQGTFGTATVSLETSFDGGTTWIAVENSSFTTTKATNFQLGNAKIRVRVAGSGGGTSVTAGV